MLRLEISLNDKKLTMRVANVNPMRLQRKMSKNLNGDHDRRSCSCGATKTKYNIVPKRCPDLTKLLNELIKHPLSSQNIVKFFQFTIPGPLRLIVRRSSPWNPARERRRLWSSGMKARVRTWRRAATSVATTTSGRHWRPARGSRRPSAPPTACRRGDTRRWLSPSPPE